VFADALAFNPQGLDSLRWQAKQDGGKESMRAAAQQFEAYFLQMMLGSMRQTLSQDGPFDSQETRTFSGMFDQQVAQSIARSRGVGLADMLVAQLQQSVGGKPQKVVAPRPYDLPAVGDEANGAHAAAATTTSRSLDAHNFIDELWPHAVDAAAEIGVSPHFLIAQAALESGWGKHEIRTADGRNSHNLFNIKAGKGWQGEQASVDTTEYVNGKAGQERAGFRVYASYAEAFADYANLLKSSARYAGAINRGSDAAGFAHGLQAGGYATDPMYADKVLRVLNSTAFRNGLAGDAAPAALG